MLSSSRRMWAPLLVGVAVSPGCRCDAPESNPGAASSAPPWARTAASTPTRPGMVWIPDGTLIAGTPEGTLPRIADEELAGVEVEMKGFFIDAYNHPGEPGAIPKTGISQAEARAICDGAGKRLCTELEWERACKGPDNSLYEYGDTYDPEVCQMGERDSLAPNGVNTGCTSGFGVHDLHGSAWNWTSSAWGRGADDERVTVRGGNGDDGELVGRCANAEGYSPRRHDHRIGVRCCAGEVNPTGVALDVQRGSELSYRPFEADVGAVLDGLVPKTVTKQVSDRPPADQFRVERLWMWRPIGNEELILGGGCAHPPGHDACGVVIARLLGGGRAELIAFVDSDWWIPTVGDHSEARTLYLYGGDIGGAFRKPVRYEWGRIVEGEKGRKRGGAWVN